MTLKYILRHIKMEYKREIFTLQLKTHIEWLAKLEEAISNLKKWFITVWTAVLGFSISNSFSIGQTQTILFTVSLAFSILHLVMLANKHREFAVYESMQEYLLNLDDETLKSQNEILSTVIKKTKKIKKYRFYFLDALGSWQENSFFFLVLIGSILIPCLLK